MIISSPMGEILRAIFNHFLKRNGKIYNYNIER